MYISASAPDAPPLSHTTMGCFIRCFFWSAACTIRAIGSEAPPAPAATTISTGLMQAAIQKNNLMKQPMVVSLKGGASGAEALMYMKSSEGDPNKVLIAYSLIYMLPLSAKIPFNWRELTPVSLVALDQFVLWDNAAGPK